MPQTMRRTQMAQRAPARPRARQRPDVAGAVYWLHGRRVWSEMPLPCPRLADGGAGTAEIELRLRRGATPTPPDGSLRSWLPCPIHGEDQRVYRHGGETWIWQRGVATVHIGAGADCAEVYVDPEATDDELLGHFLLQPVLVHMLNLRGCASLHAGAVAFGPHAVALLGPSHYGKSTLTAGLVRRGATLLCDDALVLRRREGTVDGIPGPAHLKVWPASLPDLLPDAHETAPLSAACEKLVVTLPAGSRAASEPVPIRAALLLARYDGAAVGRDEVIISELPPSARLAALVAHTLGREHLLPAEEAALLPTYAALAQQADVRVLHYPSGLSHLDAVVDAVRALVGAV